MNQALTDQMKNTLLTLLFYLVAVSLIVWFNLSGQFKSGPCTPNLDGLSYFILGPLSFLLMGINGVLAYYFQKPTKPSFFIHLLALSVWTSILLLN